MIPTTAIQRTLRIDDPKVETPLLSMMAVRATFPNASEETLTDWLTDAWIFNLASGSIPVLHILNASIAEIKQNAQRIAPITKAWPLEKVLASALPHSRPTIFTRELARAWNCSHDLITDLIRQNSLRVAGKNYRTNETRLVLRESALAFLKERNITK